MRGDFTAFCMANPLFRGAFTALITPFADRALDEAAYVRFVNMSDQNQTVRWAGQELELRPWEILTI